MPRTIDDVLAEIEQIAFSPEAGADKMRALKILKDQQASTVFLPDPQDENECINRLARLMKAQGKHRCRLAYQRAYPLAETGVGDIYVEKDIELTAEEQEIVDSCTRLRKLWQYFPELRARGAPRGMPQRNRPLQMFWLKDQAVQAIKARKLIRNAAQRSEHAAAADHEIGTPDPETPAAERPAAADPVARG